MNPTYLARIRLNSKTPGTHGLLYWQGDNIWMHNEVHGWNTCEKIPCQEEDARDVINMCWYLPEWELEMLKEKEQM